MPTAAELRHEMREELKRLWLAVAAYGLIGFEGSQLLEVMSDARAAITKARGS
jgi:hypothetical protein